MKLGSAVLLLVVLAIALLLFLFATNNIGGLSLRSWGDAQPTPEQVAQWTVKNFNSSDWTLWNKDPGFDGEGIPFNSGVSREQTLNVAPWGNRGWGLRAYGWGEGESERGIYFSNIKVQNGVAYVSAWQKGKQFGNGTLIQGWNWNLHRGVQWNIPTKVFVGGRKFVVSLDIKIDAIDPGSRWKLMKWVMVGTTFWFRSQELSKPLVIDLGFGLSKNIMFSREDSGGYHYQRMVVLDKNEAIGRWRHYDLDLSWFIDDACQRYKISDSAKKAFRLQSMEALIETKNAGGSFWVDNFALYYKDK